VAAVLAGAWRAEPPPLELPQAEVETAVPLLLAGGAGALAWWRLRATPLAANAALAPLFEAYRAYTLEAAVRQRQLAEAASALHGAGVEALLGKGWAAARHYAQPALRPYGDLDFFLDRGARPGALAVLQRAGRPLPVDLHEGFAELDDRGGAALAARAVTVSVLGTTVRLFAPEDHLRLLCLHLLRHGASRPLWLCDVAAIVEAHPFLDWDLVLAGERRVARAVGCVVGLASNLLGTSLPETSALVSALRDPPRWLRPAVLQQWGKGSGFRIPVADQLRRPDGLWREVKRHWPNPIEATAGVGAPFNDRPRWPFQAEFAFLRALRFARSRGRFDR
jgi:hypothetical protein